MAFAAATIICAVAAYLQFRATAVDSKSPKQGVDVTNARTDAADSTSIPTAKSQNLTSNTASTATAMTQRLVTLDALGITDSLVLGQQLLKLGDTVFCLLYTSDAADE